MTANATKSEKKHIFIQFIEIDFFYRWIAVRMTDEHYKSLLELCVCVAFQVKTE